MEIAILIALILVVTVSVVAIVALVAIGVGLHPIVLVLSVVVGAAVGASVGFSTGLRSRLPCTGDRDRVTIRGLVGPLRRGPPGG